MKTAASLAGAAKGAAAGPLGAAIGAAIQNRGTIKKAAIIFIILLMLPVLFILMLPGLIFGSLLENTGSLNSSMQINDNIRAANQAIVEVLRENHDSILADVNAAASRIPEGDTVSITDPYAYYISVNANLLIAQFCASRDRYEDINVNELKRIIRKNKDGLFSYDVSTESVSMEVTVGGGAEGEAGEPARAADENRHIYPA